jgi:manganese-dependent inorganic pyrophosphatase
MAYNFDSLKNTLDKNSVIIVGDRYDVLTHAIVKNVRLILLTGGRKLPVEIIKSASANNVCIISVPHDTYTCAKLLNECNFISTIVKNKTIVTFHEEQYLSEVKEEVINSSYRNYPVLDDDNKLIGFINRRHVLNPGRKKVILVDHNEYAQSAPGLDEAEILEIIDHHKIGDIATTIPINFRNSPVGSTCTIIFNMYKEHNIQIPNNIAGCLLSGIISDTLYLKSPTSSEQDKKAIEELIKTLDIDIENYSKNMFRSGTSLEGHSIDEIFNKDLKEFFVDKYKIGISQVFTLDIENVFNRKKQFLNHINKIHNYKNYFLTLMLVTDIL